MKTKIGIDINGVLMPYTKCEDVAANGGVIATKPFPGAFNVVKRLVKKFGKKNVFLLSRAPREARKESDERWLRKHRFCEQTGVPESNVVMYIGKQEEKAAKARELGITHMIDDRLDVLDAFDNSVVCIAFAAEDFSLPFHIEVNGRPLVIFLPDWQEIAHYFEV